MVQACLALHGGNKDAATNYAQDPDALPEDLVATMRRLSGAVRVHTQVPASIASGYANLVHKVSASLQGAALERPFQIRFQAFCSSIAAVATDMGVEFGMADLQCSDVSTLLPPWQHELVLDSDMTEANGFDEVDQAPFPFDADLADADLPREPAPRPPPRPPPRTSTHVYPNALTIPGALHIVRTLVSDMTVRAERKTGSPSSPSSPASPASPASPSSPLSPS